MTEVMENGSRSTTSGSDEERSIRTAELLAQAADCTDPDATTRLHEQVVLLNLGIADRLAARYARRGLDEEDLQQVARLALVRVVPEFRPEFNRDFLAYAVPSILGTLRKHFRDCSWGVRPPRPLQEARFQINRIAPVLMQELGRTPSAQEMADRIGLHVETVLEAMDLVTARQPLSLERSADRDDGSAATGGLGALLGVMDREIERCELRTVLGPLVEALPERDQEVIRLRFYDQLTQREIGERIGVSQMQISRILTRICEQLRAALGAQEDFVSAA